MKNISLDVSPAQLDYLLELVTQDVALSLMTLGKLENTKLKARLQLRIDNNRKLLNDLRAKKNECCEVGSRSDSTYSR